MSDRYQILEQIGKGGLGAVYKGLDTQLQREVAIKRVLPSEKATEQEIKDAASKLIAEAQTLSSLNHPNIVTVFDVGRDEQGGFVVMELLKGETLDETVERGVLTQEDFAEVVQQTMEALISAQASNVIHRDIKPSNIMVIWQASGKFQLKILDFGLAKFSKTPSVQTMDQDESVMGSIFFMAPEQFERGELDARTDLYQMGCVYYNALTGQYPFNGDTAPQVMNAHLQHRVIPLQQVRPGLSPSICEWVMWLINRDIAHRPSDARDALSRWPKNPRPPGSDAVSVLPIEDTPEIATGAVVVVRAAKGATAPPRLIIPSGQTGKAPTLVVGTGPQSSRVSLGKSGKVSALSSKQGVKYEESPSNFFARHWKWIAYGVVLLIGSIWWVTGSVKRTNERAREKRIQFLAGTPTPTGTTADVDLAASFLTRSELPESMRSDALKVLATLEGVGISERVFEKMQSAPSVDLKIKIAETLAERNYVLNVSDVLAIYKAATSDEQRIRVLASIRSLASAKDVPVLMGFLQYPLTIPVRTAFEETILAIIRRTGDSDATVDTILNRIGTTSGDERQSLFRVLGTIGGDKVRERLKSVFGESGDVKYQRDAIGAYLKWRDRSVLPDLDAIIAAKSDDSVVAVAQEAYLRLCQIPGPEPVTEMVPLWKKAFTYVNRADKARDLIDSLLDYPYPETIAVLKEWGKHPTYGKTANDYVKTLTQQSQQIAEYQPGGKIEATKGRVRGRVGGAAMNSSLKSYTQWTSPETWFRWEFKPTMAGQFYVEVVQSSMRDESSDFFVYFAGKSLKGESKRTESWDKFEPVRLSEPVTVEAGKPYVLIISAGFKVQPRMMDIGEIRLVKP